MSNKDVVVPCVKVKPADNRSRSDLKELAKQLAQRNYAIDDNPAIKRLEQRFAKI